MGAGATAGISALGSLGAAFIGAAASERAARQQIEYLERAQQVSLDLGKASIERYDAELEDAIKEYRNDWSKPSETRRKYLTKGMDERQDALGEARGLAEGYGKFELEERAKGYDSAVNAAAGGVAGAEQTRQERARQALEREQEYGYEASQRRAGGYGDALARTDETTAEAIRQRDTATQEAMGTRGQYLEEGSRRRDEAIGAAGDTRGKYLEEGAKRRGDSLNAAAGTRGQYLEEGAKRRGWSLAAAGDTRGQYLEEGDTRRNAAYGTARDERSEFGKAAVDFQQEYTDQSSTEAEGGATTAAGVERTAANRALNLAKSAKLESLGTRADVLGRQRGETSPYSALGITGADALQAEMGTEGRLGKAFSYTAEDFEGDPGHRFRLEQAQKAAERSAAGRGGLLSGRAALELNRNIQGVASDEYSKAYGRKFNEFQTDQDKRYERLSGLVGVGQDAAALNVGAESEFGRGAADDINRYGAYASGVEENLGIRSGNRAMDTGMYRASGTREVARRAGDEISDLGRFVGENTARSGERTAADIADQGRWMADAELRRSELEAGDIGEQGRWMADEELRRSDLEAADIGEQGRWLAETGIRGGEMTAAEIADQGRWMADAKQRGGYQTADDLRQAGFYGSDLSRARGDAEAADIVSSGRYQSDLLNRLGGNLAADRLDQGRYEGDIRAREGEMTSAQAREYGRYLSDMIARGGEMDAADYQRFGELGASEQAEMIRFIENERIARGRFVGEVNSGIASRVGSNYQSMGNSAAAGAIGVGNAYGQGLANLANLGQQEVLRRYPGSGGGGDELYYDPRNPDGKQSAYPETNFSSTRGGGGGLDPRLAGMSFEDLIGAFNDGSITVGDLYGMFAGSGGAAPGGGPGAGSGGGAGTPTGKGAGPGGYPEAEAKWSSESTTGGGAPNLGPQGGGSGRVTGSQAAGYDPISGITYDVPPGFKLDRDGSGKPYLTNMRTYERTPVPTTSVNSVGGYPGIDMKQFMGTEMAAPGSVASASRVIDTTAKDVTPDVVQPPPPPTKAPAAFKSGPPALNYDKLGANPWDPNPSYTDSMVGFNQGDLLGTPDPVPTPGGLPSIMPTPVAGGSTLTSQRTGGLNYDKLGPNPFDSTQGPTQAVKQQFLPPDPNANKFYSTPPPPPNPQGGPNPWDQDPVAAPPLKTALPPPPPNPQQGGGLSYDPLGANPWDPKQTYTQAGPTGPGGPNPWNQGPIADQWYPGTGGQGGPLGYTYSPPTQGILGPQTVQTAANNTAANNAVITKMNQQQSPIGPPPSYGPPPMTKWQMPVPNRAMGGWY